MRWSKYYLPTFKEVPAEAEIPSHQLMLRAGMIKKLTSGVYTFLPLGHRVLKRVEKIVREEMDRAGAQEIMMPVLHPGELYEETGRLANFGDLLFKLQDRRGRFFALGPTHEEVVTDLARAEIKSYRQLPQTLYQIQVKFRDEFRPRFGVMRAREFIMKDAYSFHESQESLTETYQAMADAYARILERCGLASLQVEAESGAIGGDVNHEFIVLAEQGESAIFRCPECSYAANDERANGRGQDRAAREPIADAPVLVETPGKTTVEDVCGFLDASAEQLVKTLLYRTGDRVVAALIPGERQLNEAKLARVVGDPDVTLLDDATIEALTGAAVGYAGPVGLPGDVEIIADPLLRGYDGMIVGANRTDAHLRGVRMGRDFTAAREESISAVEAGDTCDVCGKGRLYVQRGVELGHIFKLDVKYSQAMRATYLDQDGREQSFIMGCYGFGVSRAVAAAVEQHHDEKGIRWPREITPFHVIVMPVNYGDAQTRAAADGLYQSLPEAGWSTLLDDRDMRPGPKFKDAELIGIPVRFTLGERNLKDGNIEVYYRDDDRSEVIPLEKAAEALASYYGAPNTP